MYYNYKFYCQFCYILYIENISTEIKPIKSNSVDLGIIRTNSTAKSSSYILLLEVKHSSPWNLLNWNRENLGKKVFKRQYKNKRQLSLPEILFPNISITINEIKKKTPANLLKDLYKLKTIINRFPSDSRILVGLAFIIEKVNDTLEKMVVDRMFTAKLLYSEIIKVLPQLTLPDYPNLTYIELKGWTDRQRDWTIEILSK